ncbi:MAG: hypothetical protein WA130_01210 [Candidatus Methanoperedens sp.]
MPKKEFLEKYPLYQKFKIDIPDNMLDFENAFGKPSVHLKCDNCHSDQTFIFNNQNYIYSCYERNYEVLGKILHLDYLCAGCHTFHRSFLIKVSDKRDYFMKVGQYPAWDISIDTSISTVLGKHEELFKKGLICESQGYGIGAYAYYRRIVELIIDDLLDDITDLVEESGRDQYKNALAKTKETSVVSDKIELVKNLLPVSLKPSGINPLGFLYSFLSEGIHGKSDEECIEIATELRRIIIFLIKKVIQHKQEAKELTESMKKVLEKKSKKG